MKNSKLFIIVFFMAFFACSEKNADSEGNTISRDRAPFFWENATIYFMLTDRFYNGDPSNDTPLGREKDGGPLRNFMGGDLKGITQKIEEGYFDDLGVTAIWVTPPVEQIHGTTDEGWGKTYGYHGYWTRDWTNIDPNFGTMDDLREMVDQAHAHGIRILLDVVLNHTGPVTPTDGQWPEEWVRTSPACTHQSYETSVPCTLVENLPDIRTDSDREVDLPDFLKEKWRDEGRLESEMEELDRFFQRSGYPRLPKYYIIKWLTDFVREMGIDGFRVDTAKHVEAGVWSELYAEAVLALEEWRALHPEKKIDDLDFYMVGEVYGYGIQGGLNYDYGDSVVNFFDHDFKALINFSFKSDASREPEALFSEYSDMLNGTLKNHSVVNYISSHDDGGPFDLNREKAVEAGTMLLLAPGAVQIYYGDELARPLVVEGTKGDAHLRSFMNWEDLEHNVKRGDYSIGAVLHHWQKLGQFRREHPSVGAGKHEMLSMEPYVFSRTLQREGVEDRVMVIMGQLETPVSVNGVFKEGTKIKDYYTGEIYLVNKGKINANPGQDLYLLGQPD